MESSGPVAVKKPGLSWSNVRDIAHVINEVRRLAAELSGPGAVAAGTETESATPPTHPAPR
jgi:hypothetical protein